MVNIQKNLTFIVLVFFILALAVVFCGKVPIKKRSLVVMEGDGSRDVKDQKSQPIKRTFCNAFTGCQGKRSDASAGAMKDYDYGHESVKEGTDENFVGDVARDILAEARLWEALQARNSMRYPVMRKQGFFGREKRATKSEEGGFNRIAPHNGIENRNNE